MSDKLTQAVSKTGGAPANTVSAILQDPKMAMAMKDLLPRTMTPERMLRVLTGSIRMVPALANCEKLSFVNAIMTCAQLGLEPGPALGHAYLIPFENRKKGITECQFIVGYKGLIDLARRSGQIVSISARVVREGDKFDYAYGLDERLTHVPSDDDSKPMTHVYAVAKLKDGGTQFEVLTRRQIEGIRAKSRGGNYGPWQDHFEEMARKSAIRRLAKYLPMSLEGQKAITLDEAVDAGLSQSDFMDGELPAKDVTPTDEVSDNAPTAEEIAEMEKDMK